MNFPEIGSTFSGFVDLQVNGYRGIDFSSLSLTLETATHAIRGILSDGGCTSILPTIISSSLDVYNHVLPIFSTIISMKEFNKRVLGIHLEGPFISSKNGVIGCHSSANVIAPSINLVKSWQKLADGHICMITVAAEAQGISDFIKYCVKNRIMVSLGHQDASADDIEHAIKSGATAMTHLGNGLPNMIHRHHNPIWKGLSNDQLSVMLIADGNHLPEDLLRVMFRSKPSHLIIATSDVAPVAGLPDGTYNCFGTSVVVEGNNVRSAKLPCLAGSGALILDCINHLCSIWPLDYRPDRDNMNYDNAFETMIKIGNRNPLNLIGRESTEINNNKYHILTWMDGKFIFTASLL